MGHKWKKVFGQGVESPGVVRGERAESMHSGTAEVVALVVKAFESSLLVASISSLK